MIFAVGWPGGDWQATLRLTLIILAIYLAAIWLTLIFWAFRDIRQRTRDPIIQFVAVLLVGVFFLPGHWIYLILRPRYTLTELYERSLEEESLLQDLEDQKACPTCKRRVLDEFLICPSCRTQIKEPCRACAKPLSYAWLACPFCGLEKSPRDVFAPRQAREQVRQGPRREEIREAPPPRTPARTSTSTSRATAPRPAPEAPAAPRAVPALEALPATVVPPARTDPPHLDEESGGPVIGSASR